MQRIAVVDFGTGNLHSVSKALERVAPDDEVVVTRDSGLIENADRVVLPGQGAMGSWLEAMDERNLRSSVSRVIEDRPVLGICLGMQALMDFSEEDNGVQGLGIFPGTVRRFVRPADADPSAFKIPHMGWNQVRQARVHPMWNGIDDLTRFYFVHSYYCDPAGPANIAGTTDYTIEFCNSIAGNNIFAVQFHPEKSHTQGLRLLANFIAWTGVSH